MDRTIIKPFEELDLKIYAYALDTIPSHDGCVKIGETSRDVYQRVREQVSILGLKPNVLFDRRAKKANGDWFHDKELHRYIELQGVNKKDFGTGADEWFYFGDNIQFAEELTDKFIALDYDEVFIDGNEFDYKLRTEQQRAVDLTLEYYNNPTHGTEFLWNAKPRFGKTLTTYHFLRQLNAINFLIVTNRPAIANSWFDDFKIFISWQEPRLKFVSDTDALKGKVFTRKDYVEYAKNTTHEDPGCIAFVSLQDLKGAKVFGGEHDKLAWVAQMNWDVLIIDEAHEGVDTTKTDKAFAEINRKFTLHLSGTPFKAIANQKFHEDQIYNWSYADEQSAKLNWNENLGTNPYIDLPTLNLFTYQLSKMVEDKVSQGIDLAKEENVDYTFDLNEFFRTNKEGSFVYEQSVRKFLDNLTQGDFPFAESKYRHKLNHTFWVFQRVASTKAMEKLLSSHPIFSAYKVVIAAGDGMRVEESIEDIEHEIVDAAQYQKSYDKVKQAIEENDKTITLSVGQLTTGVTIPEWSGVLILSNIKSPAFYFQTAFRAQNPYEFKDTITGQLMRKENAYIFDFAPDRTLVLFDEFANNLSTRGLHGTSGDRKSNIKELLNFFPVIAEDENGTMHELNAEEVLTIPSKIKSIEVVRRGFMSNLLFANISGIFAYPDAFKEILDKIEPFVDKKAKERKPIVIPDIHVDKSGEVNIPNEIVISTTHDLFGPAIYDSSKMSPTVLRQETADVDIKKLTKEVVKDLESGFSKLKEGFDLTATELKKVKDRFEKELQNKFKLEFEANQEEIARVEKEFNKAIMTLENSSSIREKEEELDQLKAEIITGLYESFTESINETVFETVESQSKTQEEKIKKTTEDEVRNRLRGFSRTIPSFLMAFGDRETRLKNFEEKIDDKTFEDVASISKEEFQKLRDGFSYIDNQGEEIPVPGLFDEIVFNASIQEFFVVKEKYANYLTSTETEDIFDYIPPQKTNQVFTPKDVVGLMVSILEQNDPLIFSRKDTKFLDPYAKSGLFLTTIAKKLFVGLEEEIPNEQERIKWILENQIYAFAPTNILYNIVKTHIFSGFDFVNSKNIYHIDLLMDKESRLINDGLMSREGEVVKFDVIIGNPPFQEETKDTSDNPIYHLFIEESYKLASKVCLITPARFLFNAGKTPKSWNEKMLNDKHLTVAYYEADSAKIFPGPQIRGGISITYRDQASDFGKIGKFIPYKQLKSIHSRVISFADFESITSQIYSQNKFNLDRLYKDFPEYKNIIGSNGREKRLTTNIINQLGVFSTEKKHNDDVNILGLNNNIRITKFIPRKYLENIDLISSYRVILPKSNGGGKYGEILSTPIIAERNSGYTQSFIGIGSFASKTEANSMLKYIKTKFVRSLLSILKVTQDNSKSTWAFVPTQDFGKDSSIDWSKSISEIDSQLYEKYGLTQEEIDFIETKVTAME